MNLKQIQELIKFVAKSGATEVDLEMGDVKICIKSPPKGKVVSDFNRESVSIAPVAVPPVAVPPVAAPPVAAPPVITEEKTTNQASDQDYLIIKSPIIGTFYRRPSPEKDPFINVGNKIDEGTVVGIVEAMKLFNEIESEISGTIVKVLVDDMSPVEYDQPLFLVDPN